MRTILPDRRASITVRAVHTWSHGNTSRLLVTFGFDSKGQIKELFCADFKEGTDMHGLITDSCVVLSLLLQHGYSVREIRDKLSPAPISLLATLINTAMEIERS